MNIQMRNGRLLPLSRHFRCKLPTPSLPNSSMGWPTPLSNPQTLQLLCNLQGSMAAMSPTRLPCLHVYKDGKLLEEVSLQGQERWIAGRHADCHLQMAHASTSRRHLEIRVRHGSKEILIVDLHSAHGTRVNGKELQSGSPYAVKPDDIVQMGASTRSYKLEWVAVLATNLQSSEAATSTFERSSPNGKKATSSCKLHNIQGGKKATSERISKCTSQSIVPSPGRVQGQRGGRPDLPPRTPARRVPFATVQLNARSPQGQPSLRKATTLPENLTTTKVLAVLDDGRMSSTTKEFQGELRLQRCSSAPARKQDIPGDDSCAPDENEIEILGVPSRECSGEHSRSEMIPPNSSPTCDEYPSDKENWQPRDPMKKNLGRQSCKSVNTEEERQPFGPLLAYSKSSKPVFSPPFASSADSDVGSRGLPPPQRPETSALVNNLDSLFSKLKVGGESRCEWHVVVDTNCLLDADALKSLKQLEGIRETRIIIPKIVLRELDGLKSRHDVGHSARMALKWIEDCMERIPFWMHVQKSTETFPVRRDPPSPPSRIRRFSVRSDRGVMSPTNDDHILDCALLFDRSVTEGRVVFLTRDTALKIKAMAEGLTVEDATSFSESLLSPYSERFIWRGSTAYHPPVKTLTSRPKFTGYDESYAPPPRSNSPFAESNVEMRRLKTLSPPDIAEHRCHYREQPQGLQVVLT